MPHILITGDDGPNATGLRILREAVQKVWPSMKPVIITGPKSQAGKGMALSNGWETWKSSPINMGEQGVYTVSLTPVDIIYRAFHDRESFSTRDWELVLVGVNHGSNTGTAIYHSGTTSAAMAAATFFGCPAFAFSQELDNLPEAYNTESLDRALFDASERVIPDFLRKNSLASGMCWNVNIPKKATKGYKEVPVAHYNPYRIPPTDLVPRARKEDTDITALAQGYVTLSELQLRVTPTLRY